MNSIFLWQFRAANIPLQTRRLCGITSWIFESCPLVACVSARKLFFCSSRPIAKILEMMQSRMTKTLSILAVVALPIFAACVSRHVFVCSGA